MEALQRLDRALVRLEAAIDRKSQRDRQERIDLEKALAEARLAYQRLSEAADTVTHRLDGAIGRLKLLQGD
jgi:hypothetical protein